MSSHPAKQPTGARFGDYRLVHEAHRGHYGVLHAAVHATTNDPVWLRMLPTAVTGDKTLRSAVLAAAARVIPAHPHVSPARGTVVVGDRMALVSDFVAGVPLTVVLRKLRGRDPAEVGPHALRIGKDVVKAVAHLHATPDYVPGALSPECVMLGVDGSARVVDAHVLHAVFAARPLREHLDHLAYRAPEQLVPKAPGFRRSDVFTVATILFELLSCRPLFAAAGRAAIFQRVKSFTPDCTELNPNSPLAGIVERALAKDQQQRFADAGVMATALDAVEGACDREQMRSFSRTLVANDPVLDMQNTSTDRDQPVVQDESAIHHKLAPRPRSAAESPVLTPTHVQGLPLTGDVDEAPTRARTAPAVPTPRQKPRVSGYVARAEAPTRTSTSYAMLVEELETDEAAVASTDPDEAEAPTRVSTTEALAAELEELVAPDARPTTEGQSVPPADSIPPPIKRSEGVTGKRLGRCVLGLEIARGGMATVHLGRWHGAGGFAKTVAVKRLHPQYAGDPEFVKMLLDEARVVSRIRHPNVTSTIDVLDSDGELFIVMDYVHGVTLAHLLRQVKRAKEHVPVRIATRIVNGMLHGLHAAHEATDESGERLELIHRDVSPENVIVGVDGYSHLIDFGIARALGRFSHSTEGQVKGKLRYLSPEQVMGEPLHGQSDVFSASIVLWEALVRKRLFKGENAGAVAYEIMNRQPTPPSLLRKDVAPAIDRIVIKGLSAERSARWATAADMAEALEEVGGMASFREVGEWVQQVGGPLLGRLEEALKEVESAPLQVLGEDLDKPLSVQAGARSAPVVRAPADSAEMDLSDIPSEVDVRPEPKRPTLWIGAAAVAAVAAGGFWMATTSPEQPTPAAVRASAQSATAAPSAPTSPPPAQPSPPASAAPEPTTEPSAAPSSEPSVATPRVRPPTGWPLPKRPPPAGPKPNPRLPDGI